MPLFPSPRPQGILVGSTPGTHRHTPVLLKVWVAEASYPEKRGKGLRTQASLFQMHRSIQFRASWQKRLVHCQCVILLHDTPYEALENIQESVEFGETWILWVLGLPPLPLLCNYTGRSNPPAPAERGGGHNMLQFNFNCLVSMSIPSAPRKTALLPVHKNVSGH